MDAVTLVIPYYRNPHMLRRQCAELLEYPAALRVIVVDDGSPEPAAPLVHEYVRPAVRERLDVRVYRIGIDVPWNREGARNLGAHVCETDWLVHVDIDHVLPAACVPALLAFTPHKGKAYRFPRYRVGAADATRLKDKLPNDAKFGRIHPHVDSYLIGRARYWKVGGYDEDFAGVLGGGNEFLKRCERHCGPFELLPDPICLHVHTRDVVPDASDLHCSRDKLPGSRRWREKGKLSVPTNPLRFPWERVL
jgi:hypothetical protein